MADRTKDRTKAVVERSTAKAAVETPSEVSGEITAPLSAAELAAELAGGTAATPSGPDAELTATQVLPVPAEAEAGTGPTAEADRSHEAAGAAPEAEIASCGDSEDDAEVDTEEDTTEDDTEEDTEDGTDAPPERLPVPERHSGDRIADRYRLEECISRSEAFSSWRAVDEKLRRAVGVHLLAAAAGRPRTCWPPPARRRCSATRASFRYWTPSRRASWST